MLGFLLVMSAFSICWCRHVLITVFEIWCVCAGNHSSYTRYFQARGAEGDARYLRARTTTVWHAMPTATAKTMPCQVVIKAASVIDLHGLVAVQRVRRRVRCKSATAGHISCDLLAHSDCAGFFVSMLNGRHVLTQTFKGDQVRSTPMVTSACNS